MKALEILKEHKYSLDCLIRTDVVSHLLKQTNEAIKELESLENRKCENCKKWVGNAPFKGFCSVTGSSCCLGGCNDYFELKGEQK